MQAVFISKGSGYADDRTQDGFTILAEPCPTRESRVFGSDEGKPGTGTCYAAYSIRLAVREERPTFKGTRQLYLLINHGGGSEVLALPTFYDRGEFERSLIALPERVQYATLFTLYQTAKTADQVAKQETANRWAAAFREKRIKSKRSGGMIRTAIEPAWLAKVDGKTVGRFVGKTAMDDATACAKANATEGAEAFATAEN